LGRKVKGAETGVDQKRFHRRERIRENEKREGEKIALRSTLAKKGNTEAKQKGRYKQTKTDHSGKGEKS